MKLNFFQKIIVAIYSICLVGITTYLPFIETYRGYRGDQIVYDFIWSSKLNISLSRVLMEFLALTVISGISFLFLSRFKTPDFSSKITQNRIKKIFTNLLLSLVVILIFNTSLDSYNNSVTDKWRALYEEIKDAETSLKNIKTNDFYDKKNRTRLKQEIKSNRLMLSAIYSRIIPQNQLTLFKIIFSCIIILVVFFHKEVSGSLTGLYNYIYKS